MEGRGPHAWAMRRGAELLDYLGSPSSASFKRRVTRSPHADVLGSPRATPQERERSNKPSPGSCERSPPSPGCGVMEGVACSDARKNCSREWSARASRPFRNRGARGSSGGGGSCSASSSSVSDSSSSKAQAAYVVATVEPAATQPSVLWSLADSMRAPPPPTVNTKWQRNAHAKWSGAPCAPAVDVSHDAARRAPEATAAGPEVEPLGVPEAPNMAGATAETSAHE